MRSLGQTLLGFAIIFVAIQFMRPVPNRADGPDLRDITAIHPTPPAVKALLQNACYDCHSNTTRYPWYAQIQPVSWWMARHIKDGKQRLNFSTFFDYPPKKADRKLEAAADEIAEGEMPPSYYRLAHPDARLTPEQVKLLSDWITGVRSRIIAASPDNDTP